MERESTRERLERQRYEAPIAEERATREPETDRDLLLHTHAALVNYLMDYHGTTDPFRLRGTAVHVLAMRLDDITHHLNPPKVAPTDVDPRD